MSIFNIFLNTVKSFDHGQKQDFTLWIDKFEHGQKYLDTFKNYWTHSKILEHGQKLADGIVIQLFWFCAGPDMAMTAASWIFSHWQIYPNQQ